MPQPVGPVIDKLLRRVRDPSALGLSRDLARTFISRAQQVINAKAQFVLTTIILNTQARTLIYPIHSLLPTCAKIVTVRDDNSDLDYEPEWWNLSNLNLSWFRTIGLQHQIWTLIGRDLLVLYPAKEEDSTVNVVCAKLTPLLTGDGDDLEIPETDYNFLLDVSELISTIRNRNLPVAQQMLKDVQQKMVPR